MITWLDRYPKKLGALHREDYSPSEKLLPQHLEPSELRELEIFFVEDELDLLRNSQVKDISDFLLGVFIILQTYSDLRKESVNTTTQNMSPNMQVRAVVYELVLRSISAHRIGTLDAQKMHQTTALELLDSKISKSLKISDVLDEEKTYYFDIPPKCIPTNLPDGREIDVCAIIASYTGDHWLVCCCYYGTEQALVGAFTEGEETENGWIRDFVLATVLFYSTFDNDDFETLPVAPRPNCKDSNKRRKAIKQASKKSSMFYIKRMRLKTAREIPPSVYKTHKRRLISNFKWRVRGFYRRQRYGKGRTKIREIWIAPHTRGVGKIKTALKEA